MRLAITLCALVVLAGCQKESGPLPSAAKTARAGAKTAAVAGPTAEEQTAGMAEAVTQGKSQAPVDVKFDLPQKPVEGQPFEVSIALLPQMAATAATVEVSGPDGLKLASEDNQFEFDGVEPSQVYRHSVRVTPATEGVYLLTLNVSLKHDPFADTRVFSVPIIVATSLGAAGRPAAGTPSGTAQQASASPQHRGS